MTYSMTTVGVDTTFDSYKTLLTPASRGLGLFGPVGPRGCPAVRPERVQPGHRSCQPLGAIFHALHVFLWAFFQLTVAWNYDNF